MSLDLGILRWVAAASLPPPPRPHLGHAAGGAGSRGPCGARNGHTTAPFTDDCQSFLDNVIASLGQIRSWNNPELAQKTARADPELRGFKNSPWTRSSVVMVFQSGAGARSAPRHA